VLLYLFFERTLYRQGAARDRREPAGARLMGISSSGAGRLAFTMAASSARCRAC
jgi:branched-chain amino acid transport system permease protein